MATIGSARTRSGLRVQAEPDPGSYPIGLALTGEQLRRLPITPHAKHGAWNYTIAPTGADQLGPFRSATSTAAAGSPIS